MTKEQEREYRMGGHITKEEWLRFAHGRMDAQEEERLYQHVADCTYCAEQFANIVEADFFAEPPAYLCEEILQQSQRAEIQTVVKVKKISKQMKLLLYSLKVGFAVAASIFLLTITTAVQQNGMEMQKEPPKQTEASITEKINRESGKITSGLKRITNQVFEFQLWEEKK